MVLKKLYSAVTYDPKETLLVRIRDTEEHASQSYSTTRVRGVVFEEGGGGKPTIRIM